MTSKQPQRADRRVELAVGIGVGLVLAGALAFAFRIDRPKYEITPTQPTIRLSFDDLPADAARNQVVTFQVKNTGRHAIRLTSVETSCGCTVAEKVPGGSIEPGAAEGIKLSVTLPNHGLRKATVFIHTDPPADKTTVVTLLLHGRTVKTPYISRMPGPLQFRSKRPRQQVVEILEVETGESVESENWLTGLNASIDGPTAELVDVYDVQTNEAAGIVIRRYTFRATMEGPESVDTPVIFSLTPQGNLESQSVVKSCPVRLVLNSIVQAYPEQLQIVLQDEAGFPQHRDIWIEASGEGGLPAVTDVSSDVAWLNPRVVSDHRRDSSQRIELTIVAPLERNENAHGNVVVMLDDPDGSPLLVPVRLIDHRTE